MAKVDNSKMDAIKLLQAHGKGELALELSQRLQEVGAAVKEVQKKGTLKLTLNILPGMPGGAVMLEANIDTVLPKAAKTKSLMFIADDGCLVRDDPDQIRFADVPGGKSFSENQ